MVLARKISENMKGEKVSYSEVMRIAMRDLAEKEFGKEKTTRLLEYGEPV